MVNRPDPRLRGGILFATTNTRHRREETDLGIWTRPPAQASGGIGTKPRTIWATISGDRRPAETIANLFANSSLSTLAKK